MILLLIACMGESTQDVPVRAFHELPIGGAEHQPVAMLFAPLPPLSEGQDGTPDALALLEAVQEAGFTAYRERWNVYLEKDGGWVAWESPSRDRGGDSVWIDPPPGLDGPREEVGRAWVVVEPMVPGLAGVGVGQCLGAMPEQSAGKAEGPVEVWIDPALRLSLPCMYAAVQSDLESLGIEGSVAAPAERDWWVSANRDGKVLVRRVTATERPKNAVAEVPRTMRVTGEPPAALVSAARAAMSP